jgi:hypothetical protein
MSFEKALWRRVYGSSAAQQMLAGRLCFWGEEQSIVESLESRVGSQARSRTPRSPFGSNMGHPISALGARDAVTLDF